jgi:hypothetical protein
MMPEPNQNGYYLYGIVAATEQRSFKVDELEVQLLPHDSLAAIISPASRTDYRRLERQEAVQALAIHQRVTEVVLREFALLPVKFGTVLPTIAHIERLLTQGKALFQEQLGKFTDSVQMEIVVLWDVAKVLQEIGNQEQIVQLKTQLALQPPEETTAERIALGKMVKAALEWRRSELQNSLISSLREVVLDLIGNPLMDDSMVANVALLVNQECRGKLEERLVALDREFESQFIFRCIGPLPPYSFATVEIQIPTFETLNKARLRLGLSEKATAALEIKQAYRHLVTTLHPDQNPEMPDAQAQLQEVIQAAELLNLFVESQGIAKNEALPVYDFSEATVAQTFLIVVRRQEIKG